MAKRQDQEQKIFQFVHRSWEGYVLRLKAKFCDDHHATMDLKTAYWAGAQSYQVAIRAILDECGDDPERQARLLERLDEGLRGFAATLNPLRRLN